MSSTLPARRTVDKQFVKVPDANGNFTLDFGLQRNFTRVFLREIVFYGVPVTAGQPNDPSYTIRFTQGNFGNCTANQFTVFNTGALTAKVYGDSFQINEGLVPQEVQCQLVRSDGTIPTIGSIGILLVCHV